MFPGNPRVGKCYNDDMKLFFDARYIRTDFHDGISRYTTELGNALAKLTDVTFIISNPGQLNFLPKKAKHIEIHSPESLKEPLTAQILNKYQPDVVFSPLQTIGSSGRQFKLLVTSHDMIYYRHRTPPKNVSPALQLGWRLYHLTYGPQRLALNNADMVVTVSHTTKRDFEAAKLTKRPIIVVPNAPQRFKNYPVTHEPTIKNIVYMGSFMPYKNVESLIAAMEWLPGKTLHLLSRISPARRKALQALIPAGADVRFYGGVTDDQYEALLADNAVLATASLDEGYGIPVAEALAMGVPAAISDIAIFHEVAGAGAVYFHPTDPRDIARKMQTLDDPAQRDYIIEQGTKHISSYTWQASARELLNAINSLF
jgi:glycosyltransferase involved in cell wall biosynthesis